MSCFEVLEFMEKLIVGRVRYLGFSLVVVELVVVVKLVTKFGNAFGRSVHAERVACSCQVFQREKSLTPHVLDAGCEEGRPYPSTHSSQ